jgi:hypothetical protein
MVAVDPAMSAPVAASSVNQLTGRFGVHFSGIAENDLEIPVAIGATFFSSAAEALGKLLKAMHKA